MDLHVGDGLPGQYVLTLVSTDGTDLTTVSAATIQVQRPDLSTAVWAATISGQTTSTITLTHVFAADGSDLPMAGNYGVYALLTLGAGHIRSATHTIPVFDKFAITD